MAGPLRRSGIRPVGDIAWGTHFCHFFETMDDLCDTVVPYFSAGLEDNELCFWLLSDLTLAQCVAEWRRRATLDLDRHIANGSLLFQTADEWYRREGVLDVASLRIAWDRLLVHAQENGFEGVRVAGCVTWLKEPEWSDFARYERDFEESVANKPMIVLCSYPLATTSAAGVLDVARTHDFALAKREGRWEMLEAPAVRLKQLSVRARQQSAVAALGLTAIRDYDLDALFTQAATLAAETLGTGRSIVWQYRPEQNDMILRAHVGWDELSREAAVPLVEGTPGHYTFTRDEPVMVIDVASDSRFAEKSVFLHEWGVATLLTALIRGHERPWGALSIHSTTRRALTADDLEFVQSLANVLALAIERKRAEEERARLFRSEQQARATAESALAKLHAIESITDSALGRMSLDELLAEMLARLRNVLAADHATVFLFDEQRKVLRIRAIDGFPMARAAAIRPTLDSPIAGPIVRGGRPLIIENFDAGETAAAAVGLELRSAMGAPLVAEEKIFGVLTVTSTTHRRFTDDELELLRVVADRVGPAIERSRLIETVRRARERLASLSRRLLSVQEEERRRLAIELHDELGQLLTAVQMNLGMQRFDAAIENVDLAMQTVRDLALDLRPPMLDDLGLAAALRWYADRFAQQSGVQTHLSIEDVAALDPGVATACFRVAQEALTNVVRHARAANVWLVLRYAANGLELTVRDDGIGFDVEAARERAARGASLGLMGMEERVSLAGGFIEIRSSPGEGTEVRVRFAAGGVR